MTREALESTPGLRRVVLHRLQQRIDLAESACAPILDDTTTIATWRHEGLPADQPLWNLAARLDLANYEVLALALALAADNDPHVARLVARAQAPVGGSRLLVGLVAALFQEEGASPLALSNGAAAQAGLWTLGSESAALPERTLSLAPHLAAALTGLLAPPAGVHLLSERPTPLNPDDGPLLDQSAAWLDGEALAHILVIRCANEREGNAAALHIAGGLGQPPVRITQEQLCEHAGWAMACPVLPVLTAERGPSGGLRIDSLGAYRGPVIVLAGPEGMIGSPCPQRELSLHLPDTDARASLWRAHGMDEVTARRAALSYRQGAGRIADLANGMDADDADAENDNSWKRLTRAVQSTRNPLDGLARKGHAHIARADLILPDDILANLDQLVARVQYRHDMGDTLGPAIKARYSPGIRALFTGESGTGKTLAAHWLSGQSGLPLYRVDQAALTSKWIGETEKNLSAVLDAAQNADVLLFFDEADALFGARTDVSDANDRHANAQTNYLLQRIEDYEGVVILATNSRNRFDPAFVRRLDSILHFPIPDPPARAELWRAHLGSEHSVGEVSLGELAMAVDLAGGHIRNIVLAAMVRARASDRTIAIADLHAATRDEYAKLGRPSPLAPP